MHVSFKYNGVVSDYYDLVNYADWDELFDDVAKEFIVGDPTVSVNEDYLKIAHLYICDENIVEVEDKSANEIMNIIFTSEIPQRTDSDWANPSFGYDWTDEEIAGAFIEAEGWQAFADRVKKMGCIEWQNMIDLISSDNVDEEDLGRYLLTDPDWICEVSKDDPVIQIIGERIVNEAIKEQNGFELHDYDIYEMFGEIVLEQNEVQRDGAKIFKTTYGYFIDAE